MEIVFHFPRKKTPRNYRHNMNETIILEKFRTGNEKTLYELGPLIPTRSYKLVQYNIEWRVRSCASLSLL